MNRASTMELRRSMARLESCVESMKNNRGANRGQRGHPQACGSRTRRNDGGDWGQASKLRIGRGGRSGRPKIPSRSFTRPHVVASRGGMRKGLRRVNSSNGCWGRVVSGGKTDECSFPGGRRCHRIEQTRPWSLIYGSRPAGRRPCGPWRCRWCA